MVQSKKFDDPLNKILGQISVPLDDVEPTVSNSDEDEGLSTSTQLTAAQQQTSTPSSTANTVSSTNYEMQFPPLFLQ